MNGVKEASVSLPLPKETLITAAATVTVHHQHGEPGHSEQQRDDGAPNLGPFAVLILRAGADEPWPLHQFPGPAHRFAGADLRIQRDVNLFAGILTPQPQWAADVLPVHERP